jgi:DNA-binding CsgD family transcriptional regulator
MNSKSNVFEQNTQLIHQLTAGMLLGDNRTELFGCRTSKKVYAITDGKTIPFENILPKQRAQILQRLVNDDKAMEDLKGLSHKEALESFAFCVFGAADSNADFNETGILKEADNFICGNDCKCLKWKSKNITINGNKLTPRQIEIIQLLATDLADKQIADQLGICHSTLDTHKSHIFELAGVTSKNGLIVKAINEKIIQ